MAADKLRLWGVEVAGSHAVCHMGEKAYLRVIYQAVVANGTHVGHHAPLGACSAPPPAARRLDWHHGRKRATNHVPCTAPARWRAAVPRRSGSVRTRKRGTGKMGLLARGNTFVDALLQ